jgi:hypothetical protein
MSRQTGGEEGKVTRRGFLNGAAAIAAAGGAAAVPRIAKAEEKGKYEKYFQAYPGGLRETPGGLGQQFFKSCWPDPEWSTNLFELFKNVKAGEAQGTGIVWGGKNGKLGMPPDESHGEYSSAVLRYYMGDATHGFTSWPYRPSNKHYYAYMSLDPDHPDEIDATLECWNGESDSAEQYIITKPGVWYNPPGVQHGPLMFREINKPFMWLVCCAVPSESQSPCVGAIPRGFDKTKLVRQQITGERKYAGNFTDIDPKQVIVPPSHKGKVVPVLFYDFYANPGAIRTINIQIIKEGNVSFGVGESTGESMYNFWEWPHKHYVNENIFLTNIDPTKAELGGEVEFWMGDGEEAEKYSITEKTLITIPADTYHLPMVVGKLESPMIMMQVTDIPIWTARNHKKLPPGFKI